MEDFPKKIFTLCHVVEPTRILLGMKKMGWGTGRWNGFGGKVEQGESIEDAAKRELLEEVGLTALDLKQVGTIEFLFTNKTGITIVHIFRVMQFEGEAGESEEMRPEWFDLDKVPFETMWQADQHWLPIFLKGQEFKASYMYDENDKLMKKEITTL